jgi:hypothetical protein
MQKRRDLPLGGRVGGGRILIFGGRMFQFHHVGSFSFHVLYKDVPQLNYAFQDKQDININDTRLLTHRTHFHRTFNHKYLPPYVHSQKNSRKAER